MTTPTLSASRFSAMPLMPPSNSTISPAWTLSRPWMRAMPSPTDSTVPTSETCASASKFAIWSRMTREISAARMSIFSLSSPAARLLSLVRMEASIIWLPILTTIPPRMAGSMRVSIATSRPARARSCCFRGRKLVVVQRVGGHDFGGGFAAMVRRKPAECADHVLKLVLAAVPCKDAEEVRRDRVERELTGDCGQGLAGLVAADQRARHELREVPRIRPAPAPAARGCGSPLRSAVRRAPGRTERMRSALLSWPVCRWMFPPRPKLQNWNLPHEKTGRYRGLPPTPHVGCAAP